MKIELCRISPSDTGFFFGFLGLVVSIPVVIFSFFTIGPGITVNLDGFVSLKFTGSLDPVWLVLAYPFLNAIGGVIVGFLLAWFYNFYARYFGGITIGLDRNLD